MPCVGANDARGSIPTYTVSECARERWDLYRRATYQSIYQERVELPPLGVLSLGLRDFARGKGPRRSW